MRVSVSFNPMPREKMGGGGQKILLMIILRQMKTTHEDYEARV